MRMYLTYYVRIIIYACFIKIVRDWALPEKSLRVSIGSHFSI